MIVGDLPNSQFKEMAFDYVVVGSGAGGAPLAARLATLGHSVLVLEAGHEYSAADAATAVAAAATAVVADASDPAREITEVPALHSQCAEDTNYTWPYRVKHYENPSPRDPKSDERGELFYPRAAGVGGCTLHNALITVAGPASDWDELAWRLNDPSWGSDVMRGYFQLIEKCQYLRRPRRARNPWSRLVDTFWWLIGRDADPTAGRHGFDGWLHTSLADFKIGQDDPQYVGMLTAAARTSWWEGMESPFVFIRQILLGEGREALDINHFRRQTTRPEGLVRVPASIVRGNPGNGHRSSAANRLREIERKFRDRLVIATDCLVSGIILKNTSRGWRADGVEYLHGDRLYRATNGGGGTTGRAMANLEVILCAGAFQTPKLLMLSGIGPQEHLSDPAIGIKCKVHSPGVGRNLQDRYEISVLSKMKKPFELLDGARFRLPDSGAAPDAPLNQWRNDGTGLYSTNGAVIAILKRSRPDLPQPDLFIFGVPLKFKGYYPGFSVMDPAEFNLFSWVILKSHTTNRHGVVTLHSDSVLDPPSIEFNYFGSGKDRAADLHHPDMDAVVEGVRFVRAIADRAKEWVAHEEFPGRTEVLSDDQIRQWVQRDAWGHHACGTCRMGRRTDPMAVTDSGFRVLGPVDPKQPRTPRKAILGLRVVDASIFPNIPGYFIVSNVYVASEKAAEVIHGDADDVRRQRSVGAGGKA